MFDHAKAAEYIYYIWCHESRIKAFNILRNLPILDMIAVTIRLNDHDNYIGRLIRDMAEGRSDRVRDIIEQTQS